MQLHKINLPLLEGLVGNSASCPATNGPARSDGGRGGERVVKVSTACSRITGLFYVAGTRKAIHRERTLRAS